MLIEFFGFHPGIVGLSRGRELKYFDNLTNEESKESASHEVVS